MHWHPRFFCLSLAAEDGLLMIAVMKRIYYEEDYKGKKEGQESSSLWRGPKSGSGKRKNECRGIPRHSFCLICLSS
jgi:hypothetical protein